MKILANIINAVAMIVVPASGLATGAERSSQPREMFVKEAGYRMSLPSGYSATREGTSAVIVKGESNDWHLSLHEFDRADADHLTTLHRSALIEARRASMADGPDGSLYPHGPSLVAPSADDAGLPVLEIYLTLVAEDWSSGSTVVSERLVGPFYAVALAPVDGSRRERFLLVTPQTALAEHRSVDPGGVRELIRSIRAR